MDDKTRDFSIPLDQANKLLPQIHSALARLGYSPVEMLWDAALRMARVHYLSLDLIAFADSGVTAINYEARIPAVLFRPLPHDYTVARLIRDFEFRPVGAFLLATDLIYNPEKTLALLDDFTLHGYWTITEDGKHVLKFPSVSKTAPRTIEDDLQTDEIHSPAPGVFFSPGICQICKNPIRPGIKFCEACGAKIDTLPRFPSSGIAIQPGKKFCPQCGAAVTPGKKFCNSCGGKIT